MPLLIPGSCQSQSATQHEVECSLLKTLAQARTSHAVSIPSDMAIWHGASLCIALHRASCSERVCMYGCFQLIVVRFVAVMYCGNDFLLPVLVVLFSYHQISLLTTMQQETLVLSAQCSLIRDDVVAGGYFC